MTFKPVMAFVREVTGRAGEVKDDEELRRWVALAVNIWNAVPQPDWGAKTSYELLDEGMRGCRNE